MDSIFMKLDQLKRHNKLPLKIMLILMVVCVVAPIAPGVGLAEDESPYTAAENDNQGLAEDLNQDLTEDESSAEGADSANDADGYAEEAAQEPAAADLAPVNNAAVTTVYTPQEILEEHVQYIFGYPDGSVRPDEGITRAEAAEIYFRLLGGCENECISTFTDLRGNEWYYQSVAYLERNGIIYGYPDGTFRPNEQITRAEYATMVVRLLDLAPVDTNVFDDVADHWAVGYINSAASEGWISGNGYGQFQPDLTITRAQVVTIINRIMNREIRMENIPVDASAYTDLPKTHWAYCAIIEASDTHEYDRVEDNTEVWRDRMLGI